MPGSTLELYRAALAIRNAHPALGDGVMQWLDAPADVLALSREPGFACWVNLGADAVPLPKDAKVLVSSGALTAAGDLPSDTAVWLG